MSAEGIQREEDRQRQEADWKDLQLKMRAGLDPVARRSLTVGKALQGLIPLLAGGLLMYAVAQKLYEQSPTKNSGSSATPPPTMNNKNPAPGFNDPRENP